MWRGVALFEGTVKGKGGGGVRAGIQLHSITGLHHGEWRQTIANRNISRRYRCSGCPKGKCRPPPLLLVCHCKVPSICRSEDFEKPGLMSLLWHYPWVIFRLTLTQCRQRSPPPPPLLPPASTLLQQARDPPPPPLPTVTLSKHRPVHMLQHIGEVGWGGYGREGGVQDGSRGRERQLGRGKTGWGRGTEGAKQLGRVWGNIKAGEHPCSAMR